MSKVTDGGENITCSWHDRWVLILQDRHKRVTQDVDPMLLQRTQLERARVECRSKCAPQLFKNQERHVLDECVHAAC